MRIANVRNFHVVGHEEPPEDIRREIINEQTRSLLYEAKCQMDTGHFYVMRINFGCVSWEANYWTNRMSLDLYPCEECRTLYVPSEEKHLQPNKKLGEKLKNCIAYLRDRSGGTFTEVPK